MPFDPVLAERIRTALQGAPDLTERKMFGGIGFMLAGNMVAAAMAEGGLLVRTDPERSEVLAGRPDAALMVQRGRAMKGWVVVDAAAVSEDDALAGWLEIGVDYVRTLPPK